MAEAESVFLRAAQGASVAFCAGYMGLHIFEKMKTPSPTYTAVLKKAFSAGLVGSLVGGAMLADDTMRKLAVCGTLVAILI